MAFSFIFNELNSLDEELYVESIPPFPSFDEDDNMYTIVFAYKNTNDNLRKYMRLKSTFKGRGKLKTNLSNDTFLKVEKVTFKEVEKNKSYIVNAVTFHIEPYIYFDNGEDVITITSKSYSMYKSMVGESKPRIKVYGNGIGSLTINGNVIQLNMSESWIIIDSEMREAFSNTGLLNNDIESGNFPSLKNGENVITFSGGVTKLELIPKWRV